jgi:hypothetical protein
MRRMFEYMEYNEWDPVFGLEQFYQHFEDFRRKFLFNPDIEGVIILEADEKTEVVSYYIEDEELPAVLCSNFSIPLNNELNKIIEHSCHIIRRIRNSLAKADLISTFGYIEKDLIKLAEAFEGSSHTKNYPVIVDRINDLISYLHINLSPNDSVSEPSTKKQRPEKKHQIINDKKFQDNFQQFKRLILALENHEPTKLLEAGEFAKLRLHFLGDKEVGKVLWLGKIVELNYVVHRLFTAGFTNRTNHPFTWEIETFQYLKKEKISKLPAYIKTTNYNNYGPLKGSLLEQIMDDFINSTKK